MKANLTKKYEVILNLQDALAAMEMRAKEAEGKLEICKKAFEDICNKRWRLFGLGQSDDASGWGCREIARETLDEIK